MSQHPDEIKTALKERLQKLEKIQKNKESALKRSLEGRLRISKGKGNPQYYIIKTAGDTNGIYLPKSQFNTVKRLGQKDYDFRVLKAVQNEIKAIRVFLKQFPDPTAEDVYYQISDERRKLVNPIVETDEAYIARWLNEEYVPKQSFPEDKMFSTGRGVNVRSKSEWIIANLLENYAVPYKYEKPLYLSAMGIVHPDFTVLNVRLREVRYWEHEGIMDNQDYMDYAIRKERAYIKDGYLPGDKLILTSETLKQPLDPDIVKMMIEKYCL